MSMEFMMDGIDGPLANIPSPSRVPTAGHPDAAWHH